MTPRAVDMGSVRRILIIKLSAFGDIIHALPVAAALRESFPHVELTWLVDEPYTALVSGNPFLSHIMALPKARGRQLRSLAYHRAYFRRINDVRKQQFDLTLDLQGLTKSAMVARASGAKTRLAYHWLREAAFLFERAVPRRPQSVHIVDQYLDVARFLGANVEHPQFAFHIPHEDEAAAEALLAEHGVDRETSFVTINPASALAIKQWSAAKFGALIDLLYSHLGLRSVVVTADRAVAAEVAACVSAPFANLAGRTNLKQLGAVIRRSALHICGDTGSGHLAAALSRPVIALVGPTDADRICPYGQRDHVIQHRERCGAACDWHHCQYAVPQCMEAISLQEVAAQIEQMRLCRS